MRGGQADDEASGIYGEAIQDHNELLNPLAGKFESLLQDLIQAKNRQENAGQTSTLGKLKVRVNKAFLVSVSLSHFRPSSQHVSRQNFGRKHFS